MVNNKGIVYLVGSGPGDPGLLTIKGLDCIKKADVAIYDNNGILQWQCSNNPGNNIIWPIDGRNGVFIVKVIADQMIYAEKIVLIQ